MSKDSDLTSRQKLKPSFRNGLAVGLLIGLAGLVLFMHYQNYQQQPVNSLKSTSLNKDLAEDLNYDSVEALYDILRSDYDGQLTEKQLLDGLKRGLVEGTGDEYSVYISSDEVDDFWADLNGEFVGIGIVIGTRDNQTTVIEPITDSPAQRAGLQAGDVILKVDDQSAIGATPEEVKDLIKGERGTEVVLSIQRKDQADFDVTIERDLVVIPSIEHRIQDKIGILKINHFTTSQQARSTSIMIRQAVDDFRQADLQGLVLDLRNNGGGDVSSTQEVASLWLKADQSVAQFIEDGQPIQIVKPSSLGDAYDLSLKDLKLIVLINEQTASAAEILAAALMDYDLGTVVGATSFGKTSVQYIYDSLGKSDQGLLKLTTYRWYTSKGIEVKEGITPQIEIDDDLETEDIDEQLDKALELLQN